MKKSWNTTRSLFTATKQVTRQQRSHLLHDVSISQYLHVYYINTFVQSKVAYTDDKLMN